MNSQLLIWHDTNPLNQEVRLLEGYRLTDQVHNPRYTNSMIRTGEYLPETLAMFRHGESEWNAKRRGIQPFTDLDQYKQDKDYGLTGAGKAQASGLLRATIELMGIDEWDSLFTSDLPRAYDTGRLAFPKLAEKIQVVPELNEHDWGIESRRAFIMGGGLAWLKRVNQDHLDEPTLDGPSMRTFKEDQVAKAVWRIISSNEIGQNVAIVSHGETTTAMLWELLDLPDEVVREMKNLPNVNGVVLSSKEPETDDKTGAFRYAQRINPLSESKEISEWHELISPESILAVVGSR